MTKFLRDDFLFTDLLACNLLVWPSSLAILPYSVTQSVLPILGDVPKSNWWSLTPSFWWFWTEIIDFYSKDDTFLLLNPYFSYLEMYQNQTDGRSHLGSDDCRQKSSTFYFTDLACNLIVWPSFLDILPYSISTYHTWRCTKFKLMVTHT